MSAQKEITKMIVSNKKCLLMCDSGDKNKEFNVYAPKCKIRDFIMTQDYAPDEKLF